MKARLPAAVIDTTLLSRLQRVRLDGVLPWIFARVHVPSAVRKEVGAGPGRARRRLSRLFKQQGDFYVRCLEEDSGVAEILRVDLGAGETAVIAQADCVGAIAIIDERKGARRADLMGVKVLSTGALLCALKEAGAIEAVAPYLHSLVAHGFRLSPDVCDTILASAGETP